MKHNKTQGFTLLEILIALFIFSILSLILVGALQNVISAQTGTEKNAERLRTVQMALLIISRDIEQTINRPIVVAGQEELPFMGTEHQFTLTHAGFANPTGNVLRSTLQRANYAWEGQTLWRTTWNVLDRVSDQSLPSRRALLEVIDARFQYLDKEGRFHDNWPTQREAQEALPRAVKIELTFQGWGKLSQLYVISAQSSKAVPPPPSTGVVPGAAPIS
jgi:general secretion pathway protein J